MTTLDAMQKQRDHITAGALNAKKAVDKITCEFQCSTSKDWPLSKFDRKVESLKWWNGEYVDHLYGIHWLTDKIVKMGGIA